MKKFCVNCNKKQGFFSLNHKLKDGVICDDCILPFGLSHTELNMGEKAIAMNSFENRTASEIVGAIKSENNVFAEIRNEVFNKVPAGVLFKFDGGLGEHSEEVFVYEDKVIIVEKGFAGTGLGKNEKTMLFKDTVSVSLDKALVSKKDFICFSQVDGSTISIAYNGAYEPMAIKVKEFVESNIS
ncbi:MAG: hypothetical protein FWB88_10790 [Defluviitaleaceae bacterium]|nr:hypothetical protein [Defluviitaleaceae bacterium]MCL2240076.1 hypothetical protein [Defluviitaleaceae bacterium]MCL2240291.1 hypothetical protein [Defluviitaleaceae bacterium]